MLGMKRIVVSVISAVLFSAWLSADDSALFNKFIDAGEPVVLERGRVYHLSSDIHAVSSDNFAIYGNGARIVIDKDFPLERYERIFEFNSKSRRNSFVVSDLEIISELGQKFSTSFEIGDTFIFDIGNVKSAKFDRVRITDNGKYNNLTFIVSSGPGKLSIRNCEFHSASLSSQGGAVWIMNDGTEHVNAEFQNVVFDFDDRDECLCFGVSDKCGICKCQMALNANNCFFTTKGDSPSSGFVIAYNHSSETVADIRLNYSNCRYVSRGKYSRRIQSYQANISTVQSAFHTSFDKCSFDFHSLDMENCCLTGLLPDSYGMPLENITYSFKRCRFDIDRCILADRVGGQSGLYMFNKCSIISTGNALVKNYNYGYGTIVVAMKDTDVASSDIFACSETIKARNSNFKHLTGQDMRPQRASLSDLISSSSFDRCYFNDERFSSLLSLKNARVVVDRYSSFSTISEMMCNEVISSDSLNSLAVYLKENIPVYLNGKRIVLSYLADEGNFYAGINLSDLKRGRNQFIFGDEVMEFYYK